MYRIYLDVSRKICKTLPVNMGSLAFALLRQDHIVIGADRRHTRGDDSGNYRNDAAPKTMTILGGSGVLAFAGHDFGEQILIPAKNEGKLDGTSLKTVAHEFGRWAKARYEEYVPDFAKALRPPSVQFLLAGFDVSAEGVTSAAYRLGEPEFWPHLAQLPFRNFEVIGRSFHGALYALHRFGEHAQTVDAGLRLAAFVLSEISECDTTIGGLPELFVIPKSEKASRLTDVAASRLHEWAKAAGANLGKEILNPTDC